MTWRRACARRRPAEEFEQATLERNRLRAVHSLLERQRVANESVGTLDAVAVAVDGREANAQVFQVRDGVLSDRQSFYLSNETERDVAEVAEEFMLQYYGGHMSIPALLVVQRELAARPALAEALASRRGGQVELRAAERGEKRRILELAERNARLALDQERLRSERRRQSRVDALEGLREALALDVPPIRIECFDISNLGGTHTVASMVVFEGGAPKKADYRRFTIRDARRRSPTTTPRWRRSCAGACAVGAPEPTSRRTTPHTTRASPSLPNVVVIDGGKGQLAAGLAPLRGFRDRGVAVVSLAKRIEELYLPGRRSPLVLDHSTPALQLLQRVRDEAHRFAITHHRSRRDRAMTGSLLDELPGVGPARKRALLTHFGSPEAIVSASSEELAGGAGSAGQGRARTARPPAPRRLSRSGRRRCSRIPCAWAARRLKRPRRWAQ